MEQFEQRVQSMCGVGHRHMATCSGKISATCALLGINGNLALLTDTTLTDLKASIKGASEIAFSEQLVTCALDSSLMIVSDEGAKNCQIAATAAFPVGDKVIAATDSGLQLYDKKGNQVAKLEPCGSLYSFAGRLLTNNDGKIHQVELKENKLVIGKEICKAERVQPHGAGCLIIVGGDGYKIVNAVTGEVHESNDVVACVDAQSQITFAYGLEVARKNPVLKKFIPTADSKLYKKKFAADASFDFVKSFGQFSIFMFKEVLVVADGSRVILHFESLQNVADESKSVPISSLEAILDRGGQLYHLNRFGATFRLSKEYYKDYKISNGRLEEAERQEDQQLIEHLGHALKLSYDNGYLISRPDTNEVVCRFDEQPDVHPAGYGLFFVSGNKNSGILDVVEGKFLKHDEKKLQKALDDPRALETMIKMKFGQEFVAARSQLKPFAKQEKKEVAIPPDDVNGFEEYCLSKAMESPEFVEAKLRISTVTNRTSRDVLRRGWLAALKNRIAIISEKETLNVAEVK